MGKESVVIEKRSILKIFFIDLPHAIFSISILYLNTMFWIGPVIAASLFKLIVPLRVWRRFWGYCADRFATGWAYVNLFFVKLTMNTTWGVNSPDALAEDGSYLIIANHQSWVDIVVLQMMFTGKVPFLKFFLKKELIWVPLLGLGWWALDYPFMKRYSKSFLEKHPHLKGRDIEITRKACRKFEGLPVAIMNFVEGTRFTAGKHQRQKSPYAALLRPKAGGIGFVLSAMGERLDAILNVTIVYPGGIPSFMDFLCGRISSVEAVIERIPVSKELLGDYSADEEHQQKFKVWLNGVWERKDALIQSRLRVR
jgi:1-acyl-sn-glycerol-3-phosphate acyltransferase